MSLDMFLHIKWHTGSPCDLIVCLLLWWTCGKYTWPSSKGAIGSQKLVETLTRLKKAYKIIISLGFSETGYSVFCLWGSSCLHCSVCEPLHHWSALAQVQKKCFSIFWLFITTWDREQFWTLKKKNLDSETTSCPDSLHNVLFLLVGKKLQQLKLQQMKCSIFFFFF